MSNDETKTEPVKEASELVDSDMKDASSDSNEKEEVAGAQTTNGEDNATDKTASDGGDEDTKTTTKDDKDTDTKKGDDEKEKDKDKEKKEAAKKKYTNWPLRNIKEPHENDVMYGRGGGTNHHPGNKRYRKLVEDRKLDYVNSKRLDKPLVALEIIREWRGQEPPGRFLKLDEKTGLWSDVGDKKAREKTSQALREKAPLIRKQQEERIAKENGDEDEDKKEPASESKTTRFAEGTKTQSSKQVRKAVLARDHSLGREYLHAGESVSVEGFSWQDPFQGNKRPAFPPSSGPTTAAMTNPQPIPHNTPAMPHNTPAAAAFPPAGRNSSHGSLGMPAPHQGNVSVGGPPPPPDYYGRTTSGDERLRQFSNSRYESWGSNSGSTNTPAPYTYPPPPPTALAGAQQQRSGGNWNSPPAPIPHGGNQQQSGNWNGQREHSLSFNPLANASITQPANQNAFDSGRSGSGSSIFDQLMNSEGKKIPPPPQGGPFGGGPQNSPAAASFAQTSPSTSLTQQQSQGTQNPQNNMYSVDMNLARSWSGGEVQQPQDMRQWPQGFDGQFGAAGGTGAAGATVNNLMNTGITNMPRPGMVKRDTSHQNENYETKPMVKKAALNRDNSLASNLLKQQYMPEFYEGKFDSDMKMLSTNLEQSSLGSASINTAKPRPLGPDERMSTLENIAMDLMVKPQPLLDGNRTSTIDALGLDLDSDPIIKSAGFGPSTMEETIKDLRRGIAKPNPVTMSSRLTTTDVLELVNEPIADDHLARQQKRPVRPDRETPIDLTQEPSIANAWLAKA